MDYKEFYGYLLGENVLEEIPYTSNYCERIMNILIKERKRCKRELKKLIRFNEKYKKHYKSGFTESRIDWYKAVGMLYAETPSITPTTDDDCLVTFYLFNNEACRQEINVLNEKLCYLNAEIKVIRASLKRNKI